MTSGTTSEREAARTAARQRMRDLGLNPTDIAKASPGRTSRQTVSAFMNGHTWPQEATLSAIDRALGWPVGTIAGIGAGELAGPPGAETVEPEPASVRTGLVIGWPADLTEDERAEWEHAVQSEAYRRAREIRAARRI